MNNNLRQKRHHRSRQRLLGSSQRPRASVFRSAKRIGVQLIDDSKGKTLAAVLGVPKAKTTKIEQATQVGEQIAKLAQGQGIKVIVFDRSGYKYHGRVKALAEAMRQAGLLF